MFEVFMKIWFLIFILPFTILTTGYEKLKVFLAKHGYHLDWTYTTLATLIIILVVLLLVEYGYR